MLTRGYSGSRAYCQSKLAQIMFTIDLAEELGAPASRSTRCIPRPTWTPRWCARPASRPWSSVEEGAEAILNLATSRALEGRSGRYFNGRREARAEAQAYDPEARRRLRALSMELTGYPEAAASTARQ